MVGWRVLMSGRGRAILVRKKKERSGGQRGGEKQIDVAGLRKDLFNSLRRSLEFISWGPPFEYVRRYYMYVQ